MTFEQWMHTIRVAVGNKDLRAINWLTGEHVPFDGKREIRDSAIRAAGISNAKVKRNAA
jgi:hypothetical protein